MLLLHQTGTVKVGEVVRYTVTYTPTLDRILPPPSHLHVRIKNTSAIPLRAAYLHGPYTLYVSCYPSTFDPNNKHERLAEEGEPDYEPQLKAGGHWSTKLSIPEEVRQGVADGERDEEGERKSCTWIIEVASQVLFSTTAAVHYELYVGRDEKSVATTFSGAIQLGSGHGVPGRLEELQKRRSGPEASAVQTKGVFSKAIRLAVDDTESLWNTPAFPSWESDKEGGSEATVSVEHGPQHGDKRDAEAKKDTKQKKQKKIHLVILTHGIHSNLGADMLYMKESIDTAAKQASEDAKQRKAELRAEQAKADNEFGRPNKGLRSKSTPDVAIASITSDEEDGEDDEEQVIVRGFNGNVIKTERGIQYLGKRLAKYVLSITYPDQPYLPVKSSISKTITRSFTGQKPPEDPKGKPIHKNSTIVRDEDDRDHNLAYRISSISFISHSLGGLVQTYAIAYIQKHSPEFFDRIKPINFVAMASPFLGLSNENPVYVKFALDFGLVGRTGQDLGLTWRAPTIAKSGWGAMVNGLVNDPHKDKQPNPGSKPLLRILPTGPAQQALKKFRNRTVYSNVVNDGIVPLRTSCLLFLDWRGLGRVEKARRENGIVGTMVHWGWNEVTGQNVSTLRKPPAWNDISSDAAEDSGRDSEDPGSAVPQAEVSQDLDFEGADDERDSDIMRRRQQSDHSFEEHKMREGTHDQNSNVWTAFLSYFKPQGAVKPHKAPKIYRRGQVAMGGDDDTVPGTPEKPSSSDGHDHKPRGPVRGSSLYTNNSDGDNLEAPPKTTFFESAGDLLNPPLPPKEFLLDPAARPRTIFHDRVYHPDDIPPPPTKRQRTFMRRTSSQDTSLPNPAHDDLNRISSSKPEITDQGSMKIEEKIARAYHKDMSWRKVLVRLEPDAHNNMIVRRMFANAYGWPVVKHMCDTHFAYTSAAQTRDEDESPEERAKPHNAKVGSSGEQVKGQVEPPEDHHIRDNEGVQPKRAATDPSDDYETSTRSLTPQQTNELRTIHSRIRDQEKTRSHRSPSEVRESRDHVPDLVSMVTAQGEPSASFSAMHSGTSPNPNTATATLHRLHRQDSARWSDRFFEGSSEDDDDDDYIQHDRGFMSGPIRNRDAEVIAGHDEIHDTKNPYDGRAQNSEPSSQPIITRDTKALFQEPEELNDTDSIISAADVEPDLQSLSLTHIGLGKSAAEQLAESSTENQRRGSLSRGIAEQVALKGNHGDEGGGDGKRQADETGGR